MIIPSYHSAGQQGAGAGCSHKVEHEEGHAPALAAAPAASSAPSGPARHGRWRAAAARGDAVEEGLGPVQASEKWETNQFDTIV